MIIQFCGLSGSGKTTLARALKALLEARDVPVEIIDGDEYRKVLCSDLGFSREDRNTNIRRLAFVASKLSAHNIVAIICAINPYESVRQEVKALYDDVKTVFIDCNLDELVRRDTKGLYKKALLPDGDPAKVHNLTGVNDPFDVPVQPDLVIHSDHEGADASARKLLEFVLAHYKRS
jgi:adenylylsulfate kinase